MVDWLQVQWDDIKADIDICQHHIRIINISLKIASRRRPIARRAVVALPVYWRAGTTRAGNSEDDERGQDVVAYAIGEEVKVAMPRGKNKRGVAGISVMYVTSQEAKFDGAVGSVTGINPRGPNGIPLYLVDFRDHENRVAIPWQAQWFREEWITSTQRRETKIQPADRTAAEGFARSQTGESS